MDSESESEFRWKNSNPDNLEEGEFAVSSIFSEDFLAEAEYPKGNKEVPALP